MTDAELRGVRAVAEVDEYPPLDHLGEYRDEPGPPARTIDRQERGDMRPGEFRYFVATHSTFETGNEDSVDQDYERMESHGDEWHMLTLKAVAVIEAAGTIQTLETSIIGGVVSDGPDDYIEEIATDQLVEMERILDHLDIEWDGTASWDGDAPYDGEIHV